MDAKTMFEEKMPEAFTKHPEKVEDLDAIYLFKITGDRGGTWTVDCKTKPPKVAEGEDGAPDCSIELTDEDFELMVKDPMQAMQLFFQGKIKITGDPVLATKLGNLFGFGG
jgi:putative sterol carrier protein